MILHIDAPICHLLNIPTMPSMVQTEYPQTSHSLSRPVFAQVCRNLKTQLFIYNTNIFYNVHIKMCLDDGFKTFLSNLIFIKSNCLPTFVILVPLLKFPNFYACAVSPMSSLVDSRGVCLCRTPGFPVWISNVSASIVFHIVEKKWSDTRRNVCTFLTKCHVKGSYK